jgi:hypothetical protein
MSLLLTVLHSSIIKRSQLLLWLLVAKNLVIVLKEQLDVLIFLFKLSIAGFVLVRKIFSFSLKKFDICFIIVDFQVPAAQYITAIFDFSKSFFKKFFLSSQSIMLSGLLSSCCNQFSTEFE